MSEETVNTQAAPLGWSDLGRYFIFYSTTTVVLTIFIGSVSTTNFTSGTGAVWWGVLMSIPITLSLYLTLRSHGRFAWQKICFRQTKYHWYAIAILGWISLVAFFCYLIPAMGKTFVIPGISSGNFPDRRVLSDESPGRVIIIFILRSITVLPVEVTFRGLVFNALLNVWGSRTTILICAVLTTGLSFYLTSGLGFVSAVGLLFAGSLLNGWLVFRSGSIWPGLMSLSAALLFFSLFESVADSNE